MPLPPLPSTPAADPHAARADANERHRRGLHRTIAGITATASLIVVVGALVTGYLAVVGTGSCEVDDEGKETCVRREWWPFTIAQRAEHWTVDGVPDGPRVEWHVNGEPWIIGAYENGLRVGPWREYWANGALRFSGTYVGDKLDGRETWFFADGTTEWTVDRRAGLRAGVERWYWPNGMLRREGRWVAGADNARFIRSTDDEYIEAAR